MIMGGSIQKPSKRYMGGKVPQKYYKEDMWPVVEDLFLKLNINEYKGFQIFQAFIDMDTDESGTVDNAECLAYFGGPRTRFTERLFYTLSEEDEHNESRGNEFKPFSIVVWNYCTLNSSQMARMIFEVFDSNNKGTLERPDIETMYRMLYNCDDFDEYYLSQIKFDDRLCISKSDFMQHCARHRHMVQPMLDFQRRIRRKTGGSSMWESLLGFRRRHFSTFDTASPTLAEAVTAIVMAEDPGRARRKLAADRLLQEQKRILLQEAEMAERELRQRERQLALEKRNAERNAEYSKMKHSWHHFESKKNTFVDTVYTTDDVWRRREDRLELYDLLTQWYEASLIYWEKQDKKEVELTIGTEEDHAQRYKDFLETQEGTTMKNAVRLKFLFEVLLEKSKPQGNVEYDDDDKKESAKSSKLNIKIMELTAGLEDVSKFIQTFDDPPEDENEANMRKARGQLVKNVDRELNIAQKYSKPPELLQFDTEVDAFLYENRRNALISAMYTRHEEAKTERNKEYIRRQFELASNYGSPITVWENVYDVQNDKMVFINCHTMENMHRNTAICEKCDNIFEQFDTYCSQCQTGRSARNARLYRPLGHKDIRLD